MQRLVIDVRPGDYAVARLPRDAPVSTDLGDLLDAHHQTGSVLVSVTSTPDEVSLVCPTRMVPSSGPDATVRTGWRLLTVRGPLEFSLTGIMAALAGALAAAGVTLFALSTFDTDHVLVSADDLIRAVSALRQAGHEVHGVA